MLGGQEIAPAAPGPIDVEQPLADPRQVRGVGNHRPPVGLGGPQLVGVDQTLPSAVDEISKWITGLAIELQRLGFRGDLEQIAQPEALAQQAATVGSTLITQSLGIASGIALRSA